MAFSHSPKIVTDGLVLCLDPADKNCYGGSGTSVTDLSGAGNTATMTNAAIGTTTSGIFTFNGTHYMSCPDSDDWYWGTNPFACEQWLNFADTSPNGDTWTSTLQQYRIEGDRSGIFVFYENSGTLEWRCENNSPNPNVFPGNNVIEGVYMEINEWHLYTVSRQSAAVFKLYIDGVLIDTDTTNADWLNFVGTLYIGNYASGDLHEFEGTMGPVRIYKGRALSDKEVSQNFNAQRSRFGV